MEEALRQLPAQLSWVLRRIEIECIDPEDVAQEAGCELEEVRSLHRRARARMGTLLDQGVGSPDGEDPENPYLFGTTGEGSVQQGE